MSNPDRIILNELDLTTTNGRAYLQFVLETGSKLYGVAFASDPASVAKEQAEFADLIVSLHEEWDLTSPVDKAQMFEEAMRALISACSATGYVIFYDFPGVGEVAFGDGIISEMTDKPTAMRVVKAR